MEVSRNRTVHATLQLLDFDCVKISQLADQDYQILAGDVMMGFEIVKMRISYHLNFKIRIIVRSQLLQINPGLRKWLFRRKIQILALKKSHSGLILLSACRHQKIHAQCQRLIAADHIHRNAGRNDQEQITVFAKRRTMGKTIKMRGVRFRSPLKMTGRP